MVLFDFELFGLKVDGLSLAKLDRQSEIFYRSLTTGDPAMEDAIAGLIKSNRAAQVETVRG